MVKNERIMEFVFKDFLIRPWKESDEASLKYHANNIKIWRNLRDLFPFPYTRKDAATWVQHAIKEGAGKEFAIVVEMLLVEELE